MEALVPITFFLSVAAVAILRPITKRLGLLLEALAEERKLITRMRPTPSAGDAADPRLARMTDLLESVHLRMERLDERVGFVERLIEAPPPRSRSVPPGALAREPLAPAHVRRSP